jgi:hypothetical protein
MEKLSFLMALFAVLFFDTEGWSQGKKDPREDYSFRVLSTPVTQVFATNNSRDLRNRIVTDTAGRVWAIDWRGYARQINNGNGGVGVVGFSQSLNQQGDLVTTINGITQTVNIPQANFQVDSNNVVNGKLSPDDVNEPYFWARGKAVLTALGIGGGSSYTASEGLRLNGSNLEFGRDVGSSSAISFTANRELPIAGNQLTFLGATTGRGMRFFGGQDGAVGIGHLLTTGSPAWLNIAVPTGSTRSPLRLENQAGAFYLDVDVAGSKILLRGLNFPVLPALDNDATPVGLTGAGDLVRLGRLTFALPSYATHTDATNDVNLPANSFYYITGSNPKTIFIK